MSLPGQIDFTAEGHSSALWITCIKIYNKLIIRQKLGVGVLWRGFPVKQGPDCFKKQLIKMLGLWVHDKVRSCAGAEYEATSNVNI